MSKKLDLSADKVLIIAELSANHGNSLAQAIETIEAAAEAGADAIKIQTYTADTMTINCDRPEFRINGGLWNGRQYYELYREAHTPWEWHGDLKAAAERVGIPLFSTPFDTAAVDHLESFDVPAYKIASFEIVDLELVRYIGEQRRPVIMSTGMSTVEEIARAVGTLRRVWGEEQQPLALLRCVSSYPAPPEDMNLATITHLGQTFGVIPGLSDHTLGSAVAVAAVAMGARLIEKHFTLRRSDGGPDAVFSIEPAELKQLVDNVRVVEAAIGSVHYGPSGSDESNLASRRSIFVVEDVGEGATFTRENIRVIRPGHGLAPHLLQSVLGRSATRSCPRGTPLTIEHVFGLEKPA